MPVPALAKVIAELSPMLALIVMALPLSQIHKPVGVLIPELSVPFWIVSPPLPDERKMPPVVMVIKLPPRLMVVAPEAFTISELMVVVPVNEAEFVIVTCTSAAV